MARRVLLTPLLVLFCLLATAATHVAAAVPSDRIFPETTKAILVIPNTEELNTKWNETQLGKLINDPVMEAFTEDLKRQLKNKFSQTGVRLGVTLDDLKGIAEKELAIGLVQPEGDKKAHAMVLVIDVAGNVDKARELLEKIRQNQIAKGAKQGALKEGDVEITSFLLPKKKDQPEPIHAFYFLHNDMLVATDHQGTMQLLAGRVVGGKGKSLVDVEAYQAVMQRSQAAAGEVKPQVRWYAEPFGYAEVVRAMSGGRKKRGTDLLKVLANQGFKAVQGIGGNVALSTGEHDILHHTFVYAPAVPDAGEGQRYKLAARVLNFPNTNNQIPLAFVPRELAMHLTLNWKIKESFEYIGTLVDEVAGEPGVFEEVLKSIATDRNGPQVDLRKELVAFLGERITLVSDCRLPVTPKSERLAAAIEVTNEAAVAKAINKIMSSDPNAHKHEIDGRVIWEIINEAEPVEVETLQIEGVEFIGAADEQVKEDDDEEKPMIPNSAVTVANGHLYIASHVDYLRDLLKNRDAQDSLAAAADFQQINATLVKLGADQDAVHSFVRTDEAYRATYELVKQGKMPEAETVLGKLLNKVLGPDEEGVLREQQIDGAKLPDFDAVRRFLGTAGTYVRSENDGWVIVGCLLSKETK